LSFPDYLALFQAAPQAHSLDSLRLATHGKPFSLSNLLGTLGPAVNSYTGVWEENNKPTCFGQVLHEEGKAHGQLTYFATSPNCDVGQVTCLLEHLIQMSGSWGARYLLADLAEDSEFLPAFRQADFNVWSRQKLLRFAPRSYDLATERRYHWRPWSSQDMKAISTLHRSLVPKLFQTIEPPTRRAALGMVLYDVDDNLLGYADLAYGPHGIWVQPVITPQSGDAHILHDLIGSLPDNLRRPVYLSIRSYQPWLESLADDLPFDQQAELALLVRYLVLQEKIPEMEAQQVFNTNHSESGVPVIQASGKERL